MGDKCALMFSAKDLEVQKVHLKSHKTTTAAKFFVPKTILDYLFL